MLNKNSLAVKKVQGQSEATMVNHKRPKPLISSKAKKLNILLSLGHLFALSSFIRWPSDKANHSYEMPCKLL